MERSDSPETSGCLTKQRTQPALSEVEGNNEPQTTKQQTTKQHPTLSFSQIFVTKLSEKKNVQIHYESFCNFSL